MDFVLLWSVLMMLAQAGARMAMLAVGDVIHTFDFNIPPAYVNWRDGKQFTIALHITRTK